MIVAVPPILLPVITPDVMPMGAAEPLLLNHVPPAGVTDSVVVFPTHNGALPVIVPGVVLTVTTAVVLQPVLETV